MDKPPYKPAKEGASAILSALDLTTKEHPWMHIASHYLQIHKSDEQ